MSRIRILHTLCRINSGGVERKRIILAQGLGSDKYEHSLICQEADGPIPKILRDAGWAIHVIGLASNIMDLGWHARAYSVARDFKPHIVHGAVYEGEALAFGIGLRMPKVKIVMEETSDPVDRRWTGNLLMRIMCMRAEACIGVSPKVARYLREKLAIPENKIHLINNAVPQIESPSLDVLATFRAQFGIGENDIVVGTVGRLEDSTKRFSDVIRSMVHINAVDPRVKLLIVGDGPDRVMLMQLVSELNLTGSVIFTGYQAEPRGLYYLMDVFVLASAQEAFGLVLVEAMLARVPVVATAVGGIPFVLDEGKAGLLIAPRQPKEIAIAILSILRNSDMADAYRNAGLHRALSKFSPQRYIGEISDMYLKLVP